MKKIKILIIDDDQDVVRAIQTYLENQQYIVVAAFNKTEGMEKLISEKPDLTILDIMMEKHHDGFEMSREIRANSRFDDMPILILTSIDEMTGVNYKAAMVDKDVLPVDGYLDKSVELNVLLSEIKELLEKKSQSTD